MFVSACGTDSVWSNAKNIVVERFSADRHKFAHTRASVEAIPYASIKVQLEGTPPAIMVLGYVDGTNLQWIASNNISISTRNGRIVHTVGFEKDIAFLEIEGNDFINNSEAGNSVESMHYQIRIESKSPSLSSELLMCEARLKGQETIMILEYSYKTNLFEEKCKSSEGWRVENLYWIDSESGFVWRSRQGLVNGQYSMEINILKPYG